MKRFSSLILTLLFLIGSFSAFSKDGVDNNPTMMIHDTIVGPGEMLLQLDALHFTGDNGQISAITLKIDVDTNLIEFIGIQNTTLLGSWVANYNYQNNEISIIYTAFSGMGYDIDGKLLDLHIIYNGGFNAPLHFKPGCEVSNVNLQNIDVTYEDGLITQITPEGVVSQDTVLAHCGELFSMPVVAGGAGFDSFNKLLFRVGYDTTQLLFQGVLGSLITGVEALNEKGVVTFNWEDTQGTVNLTTADTLFYMSFLFIGDTCTNSEFLPGSKVFNNGVQVAALFENGKIDVDFLVDIIRVPDTGGVTTGNGYYFENDMVTVVATPNDGFDFVSWEENGTVVSTDASYSFVKQPVNDTLTANFEPKVYTLTLLASPPEGGEVFGAGNYAYGEDVTVTAVPSVGYDFICWLNGNDTVSHNPVYAFVMPAADLGLTALFQIQTFLITAVPNNPDFGTATGGGTYNYGDTATVTATPFPDYKFIAWTENGQIVSTDTSYSFFVNADRDLFANFQCNSVCPAPVGLYVDSLSDSTAMLHWIPAGDESEWDLIWGEYGFDTINSGNLVEGLTETHYFLEGLDAGTVYDFYVRSVCSDEDHSIWAGPYTFTTWYVGITENGKIYRVILFPNPAHNSLSVNLTGVGVTQPLSYRIINFAGVVEKEKNIFSAGQINIDISNLSPGIYFFRLLIEDRDISKVFIKQ